MLRPMMLPTILLPVILYRSVHFAAHTMSRTTIALIDKLNASKLHPVAANARTHTKKRNNFLTASVNAKGRVFHLQQLHKGTTTEDGASAAVSASSIQRNNRGFTSSKRVTAAHAPSLYHWLFHRCGIAFEETKQLVQHRRLVVDNIAIDRELDLEYQLEWDAFVKMNVTIKMPQGAAASASSSAPAMVDVPALHRALHRSYALVLLDNRVTMNGDLSDPRSFSHRLTRLPCLPPTDQNGGVKRSSVGFADDVSRTAVNILRPAGVLSRSVHGLGLATNDVSTVRFWNNEYLGNVGVYDIRFPHGAPIEVYTAALRNVTDALSQVKENVAVTKDVVLPCRASLEELPKAAGGLLTLAPRLHEEIRRRSTHDNSNNNNISQPSQLNHSPLSQTHRLLVETPLLPYRLVKSLRRNGAFITLLKSGPFQLPSTLLSTKQRLLSVEELVAFFAFEKKMKTNLLVYTLREFERGADDDYSSDDASELRGGERF